MSRHVSKDESRQYHSDSSFFMPRPLKVFAKLPLAHTPMGVLGPRLQDAPLRTMPPPGIARQAELRMAVVIPQWEGGDLDEHGQSYAVIGRESKAKVDNVAQNVSSKPIDNFEARLSPPERNAEDPLETVFSTISNAQSGARSWSKGKEAKSRTLGPKVGGGGVRSRGARPVMRSEDSKEKRRREAENRQRLVEALFGSVEEFNKKLDMQNDVTIPSHLKVDLDEDGEPTLLRFVHVDELECIGCTYCASVAPNTFFMEDDAGRARVFAQGTESPEIVEEAIDCCPVNCISYVSFEDLVILESEREGLFGDDGQFIDQRTAGVRGVSDSYASRAFDSKASRQQVMNCASCPTRGCKDCPMFGVGQNPAYLARKAKFDAKREKSGQKAKEEADKKVQETLDDIWKTPYEFSEDDSSEGSGGPVR